MSQVIRTSTSKKTAYDGSRYKTVETVVTEYADGRIKKDVFTKFEDDPRGISGRSSLSPCSQDSDWSFGRSSPKPATQGISQRTAARSVPGQFEKEALETHNKYRKIHGAPLLEICDKLNRFAKEWADNLAATDSFSHRPDGPYGENLFLTYGSGDTDCDGIEPVESWYAEGQSYAYGQSSGSSGTGHFTQVVWKGSKKLGMAKSRSATGKTIVVANYDPPGNFIGNYASNVPPPKY